MSNDAMIKWTQASYFGIQVDEAADAWHSGHVIDVLEFEDGSALAVATETGGVWVISASAAQLQLSDTWDNPDSICVALGPDGPRHLFAGCTAQYPPAATQSVPVIMETQAGAIVPLLSWTPVADPLPLGAGSITRILVITQRRLIIVACKK